MAEIVPQVGIEILYRAHGERHRVVVETRDLLEHISGTVGTGVIEYVRRALFSKPG